MTYSTFTHGPARGAPRNPDYRFTTRPHVDNPNRAVVYLRRPHDPVNSGEKVMGTLHRSGKFFPSAGVGHTPQELMELGKYLATLALLTPTERVEVLLEEHQERVNSGRGACTCLTTLPDVPEGERDLTYAQHIARLLDDAGLIASTFAPTSTTSPKEAEEG